MHVDLKPTDLPFPRSDARIVIYAQNISTVSLRSAFHVSGTRLSLLHDLANATVNIIETPSKYMIVRLHRVGLNKENAIFIGEKDLRTSCSLLVFQ